MGGFTTTVVSQATSHPDDSAFFNAEIPGCPDCATFHGDYLGLDYPASAPSCLPA
jgi:hypothetical protein